MAKNRIITVKDIPITVSEADIDDIFASVISPVFKLYLIKEILVW